jgi:hypothetical protein
MFTYERFSFWYARKRWKEVVWEGIGKVLGTEGVLVFWEWGWDWPWEGDVDGPVLGVWCSEGKHWWILER